MQKGRTLAHLRRKTSGRVGLTKGNQDATANQRWRPDPCLEEGLRSAREAQARGDGSNGPGRSAVAKVRRAGKSEFLQGENCLFSIAAPATHHQRPLIQCILVPLSASSHIQSISLPTRCLSLSQLDQPVLFLALVSIKSYADFERIPPQRVSLHRVAKVKKGRSETLCIIFMPDYFNERLSVSSLPCGGGRHAELTCMRTRVSLQSMWSLR